MCRVSVRLRGARGCSIHATRERTRSQPDYPLGTAGYRLGIDGGACGARLAGFESPVCCGSARLAVARRLHGHDGSARTAGSRTPKDERSESFGIRTGGRRSRACGLTSFGRSGLRLPGFESRCRCRSLSLADSGHDGIRTHGHRMSSRAANATRIEVRRSVRTELRALESVILSRPQKTLRSRVTARISGFPMVDERARWE